MALGFLKVLGGVARGVGNFIRKRREIKDARIDKRIAKANRQKATLSELVGGATEGAGGGLGGGIIKSAGNFLGGYGLTGSQKQTIADKAKEQGTVIGGEESTPVWLWPVVGGLALLFLLPKLLKK